MNSAKERLKNFLLQNSLVKANFIAAILVHIYSHFTFIHLKPHFLFLPIILISIYSIWVITRKDRHNFSFEDLSPKHFLILLYLVPYTIFVFFSSGSIGVPEGATYAARETVEIIDGAYFLIKGQDIAKEISESEFWAYLYGGVRGFTGHLMLFSYLAYIGIGNKPKAKIL